METTIMRLVNHVLIVRQTIQKLLEILNAPFHELGECIIVGEMNTARLHFDSFQGDLVGFEAFVNHFHLEGLYDDDATSSQDRDLLIEIGRSIISIWNERLKPMLQGREALIYLGGTDSISIRLHLERDKTDNWVNLDDIDFLQQEGISVFRATGNEIIQVFPR